MLLYLSTLGAKHSLTNGILKWDVRHFVFVTLACQFKKRTRNCKRETCETVEKSRTRNSQDKIIEGQYGLSYRMIFTVSAVYVMQ